MSWVGWRCQRCRTEFRNNRRFCPKCAYTVYDPVHDHERADWVEPAPVAPVVAYLAAVLAALPAEWCPDHQDASTTRAGFTMSWNAPPAWAYGVGVLWDGNLGWRYLEGGLRVRPAQLVDELVPYPELVAVSIGRLLNDGPATFPIIGATRWPHGDALITELDVG